MQANISINERQTDTLKSIVTEGKQLIRGNFDKRTCRALETRGLVKITTNKKGEFVNATAKGKKILN